MKDIMQFSKEDIAITSIADIQASQETIEQLQKDLRESKKLAQYYAKKCDEKDINCNAKECDKIKKIYFEIDRIRDIRLAELDIDWDEYKAHQEDTDFDTVITICEDILEILEG